jgi:putative transposase
LRNVEDLLHERGVDITHETVRFWWNRFGTIFAAEIRRSRVQAMRSFKHRQWHLDEVFVKINGVKHYLWRAVDHEGEVLESFVTKRRDKKAALRFLRKSLKRHGQTETIVTDRLASYGAALKALGAIDKRETGRWLNNRAENSHQPFRRRERAMLCFPEIECPLRRCAKQYPSGVIVNSPTLHDEKEAFHCRAGELLFICNGSDFQCGVRHFDPPFR